MSKIDFLKKVFQKSASNFFTVRDNFIQVVKILPYVTTNIEKKFTLQKTPFLSKKKVVFFRFFRLFKNILMDLNKYI